MAKSLFVCENPLCGKTFERRNAEANRSRKIGRKSFCSLRCYGLFQGKNNLSNVNPETMKSNRQNIGKHAGNRRDGLTRFRYFWFTVRSRFKYFKDTTNNISIQDIVDLWDLQKGICPFTGWKLELPHSSVGWKGPPSPKRASLDRIDNSKGYEKGNIRFISYMANIARGTMSDSELIMFCKAVAEQG